LLTVKVSYKEITVCNCYRNIEHFLFCVRPFALHRQQPEKDKQNVDFGPPGKISADAHACYATGVGTNILVWRFRNFLKGFGTKFFDLAKYTNVSFFCKVLSRNVFQCDFYVRPIHICTYLLTYPICSVNIFKLADGLKIRDIKRRSMFLTLLIKCLQSVKADYLEIFAKC